MPEIKLSDGTTTHKYIALDPITEYQPKVLTDAFRTSGIERREDNSKIKRFFYSNYAKTGQGVLRMRREQAESSGGVRASHVGAMYHANADTRFDTSISLPPLNEVETHGAPLDHLIAQAHYKGDLFGMFEKDYSASNPGMVLVNKYQASDDSWVNSGSHSAVTPTFNAGSSKNGNSVASLSWAHTTSSNTNRILIVTATAIKSGAGGQSNQPTGVTYNGVALTKHLEQDSYVSGFGFLVMWYLINPPTGSNTVVVTWADATNNLGLAATAGDFYNVDQVTPFGATAQNMANSAATLAVTLAAGAGSLVVGTYGTAAGGTITAGSGQAQIAETSNANCYLEMSYEACVVSDAAFAHAYTTSGSNSCQLLAAVLQGPQGVVAMSADNTVGTRGFAMTVHKGKLFALTNLHTAESQYSIYSTTDAGASTPVWVTANGTGWPTAAYLQTSVTRVNNWEQKYADVMSFGNNLIVAFYEDPDSSGGSAPQVRIGYSPDIGVNWTFPAGLIIPCSDTPNIHLTTINDPFAATTPVVPALVTSDNIYTLDITASAEVFAEVMAPGTILSGQAPDSLAVSRAADGALYIGTALGDVMRVTVDGPGVVRPFSVGPHSKSHFEYSDGLEANRAGHATSIWGGNTHWLFVAYGGHSAGTYSQIFAMDYETGAWHTLFLAEDADIGANVEINLVSGSHAAAAGAGTSSAFMFENYHASPVSSAVRKYKATGYINWSEDDLIDPHNASAVMKIFMDAYDLSASTSGEHVDVQYGVNGTDWETTALPGDFLSGTSSLPFGTNGSGISAKVIRVRLNLKRGSTNTNSPKIIDWEIQVRTKPVRLKGFVVNIDIAASARIQHVPIKTVWARINATIDNVPAVAFEYGDTGTLYVDVHRELSGDSSSSSGTAAPSDNSRTSGIVPLVIEEPVQTI